MISRRRLRIASPLAIALVVLSASGCGSTTPVSKGETPVVEIAAEDFDQSLFDDSIHVDNRWFPLQPGTQLVFQGHANVGDRRVRRRVVFTVTDLTKMIDGVRAIVIWELDYTAGPLEEAELAFFAQDNDGNVWNLGQYPEEYEHGTFVKAPTWIAGLHGAEPGISMHAEPRLGTPSYSQGWGPEVNWTDRARVSQTGQQTCVPAGCYDDVLVTDEFNRDEPGAHQLKYYAPGVGNVRVGWSGAKEEERETLMLVSVAYLSPQALTKIREDALAQEARAYEFSPDVYGQTSPLEHTLQVGAP